MSSLFIALPIICCLLIPAVIGLAAWTFRRPKKQTSDSETEVEGLTQPIGREVQSREEPF